jgi:hypothetical protein
MKTLSFTLGLLLFAALNVVAQNPFKSIGKPGKVLTLSKGKYDEITSYDTLQRVGSVIVNMRTKQIVQFIQIDTVYSEANLDPTIISRHWSMDPLANKYPSLSPYHAFANNPILFIDPDGAEIHIYAGPETKPVVYKPGMAVPAGSNKFVTDAINSLNFINADKVGTDLVSTLVEDKSITMIQQSKSFNDNANEHPNYKTNDNAITWDNTAAGTTNGTNPLTGSNGRAPVSKLFHEITHRYLWLSAKNIEDGLTKLTATGAGEFTSFYHDLLNQKEMLFEQSHNEPFIINEYETPFNLRAGFGFRKNSSPFLMQPDVHENGQTSDFVTESPIKDPVLELKK